MTNTIGWNFDNSYARLPQLFYTSQNPTPVRSPDLLVLNSELAESLGLNAEELQTDQGIAILAGNETPDGASPLAQAYAGHQFGHFNMLGDGRAVLLGEQITPQGGRVDIQYKGSGRTPYSRGGDGRAAIGPMLREYIISEAMHALRIPTTRSLAVVATGEPVIREADLPGAILTRVAASHLRVGTFQFAAQWGKDGDLQTLADYAIERHYPAVATSENKYLSLLQEVIKRQAVLVAQWQLVGFIHGVMNTDNMTISGETIDYGPCAFMDTYDQATVFSSIDRQGRYAYGNQPYMAGWNLTRLAEAILPLLHEEEEQAVKLAEESLANYSDLFKENWLKGMRAKLGLLKEVTEDEALIGELLETMQEHKADYTNTFRALTIGELEGQELFQTERFLKWHTQWQKRLELEDSQSNSQKLMKTTNPAIIPRNHQVEAALEAAEKRGDYEVMKRLLHVLSDPYAYSAEQTEYAAPPAPSNRPYRTFCGT
ncbi:uncharacterized protein YdiU (UPF0061 family) [Bacillus ectoiniformans]|uniref:protein adenylyltransferase SelO n=1 Tax=Bacillus ectoiniformans TaxID=1494429 RepID=UPI00195A94DF|nr:YdiU family protein [Bacillus ectoiniformans]MBM7649918.1 uncharacterized protein YdiU (UPF0061 family) [Bacillus ectoiniformans]